MAPLGCPSQGIHWNGIRLKERTKLRFLSGRKGLLGESALDNLRKNRQVSPVT